MIIPTHRPDSCSIVISKEALINMLSKTVVFGLAPYAPVTSHYSTAKLGKSSLTVSDQCYYGNIGMDKCLKQVTDRYGTGCTFIILSNNPERIELAVKVEIVISTVILKLLLFYRITIMPVGLCLVYLICAVYKQCCNWDTCNCTCAYYIHEMLLW